MTPFFNAFDQLFWEMDTYVMGPITDYFFPFVYSFELGAAVLDALDTEVLVALTMFSLGASMVLLAEMVTVFIEDVVSLAGRAKSTLDKSSKFKSLITRMSPTTKPSTSRFPLFRQLLSLTSVFK